MIVTRRTGSMKQVKNGNKIKNVGQVLPKIANTMFKQYILILFHPILVMHSLIPENNKTPLKGNIILQMFLLTFSRYCCLLFR